MPRKSSSPATTVEATVTSKGQVTLPKALRTQLGLRTGSRIRFTLSPQGGFHGHRVLHELEDLWKMADAGDKQSDQPKKILTLEEMDEAKARRIW